MNTLLFCDVATSGFEPKDHDILEISLMLVAAAPGLEILDSCSFTIYHSDTGGTLQVPEFHRALALTCQDPIGPAEELRKVEAKLLAGPWARATRLVNRGIDFDRKFLLRHLPTFAQQLPGQLLDVNQVEFAAVALGGISKHQRTEPRTYRAEDDLVEAYEALLHYTRHTGN